MIRKIIFTNKIPSCHKIQVLKDLAEEVFKNLGKTNESELCYSNHFCLLYCSIAVAGPRRAVGRAPDSCTSAVLGSIPCLATSVSPSADSRGVDVSYLRKFVHEVLVNRLGGLSLPRKSG